MTKLVRNILLIITVFFVGLLIIKNQNSKKSNKTNIKISATPTITSTKNEEKPTDFPRVQVIATNLEIPWSIVFLPDGSALFTERPGRVRMLDANSNIVNEPVFTIKEVDPLGEGGLLGIEKHPDFTLNNYIYLYYTYRSGLSARNKVVRYIYKDGKLTEDKVIIDNIPAAMNHDGGRIKFGPDKLLYITTGDASSSNNAQDTNSLSGKILRLSDDGSSPSDNPFNNAVYSYGHRNPEGITWDDQGRLWETEHGSSATDEVNLIQKGGNYGWPVVRGTQTRNGMISPVIQSGSTTWAPSGVTFFNGYLYFAGLKSNTLFKGTINGSELSLDEYLQGQYGRLRTVVSGPDGMLYILTSNRDGRGNPTDTDDRIIRVNPEKL